MRLTLAGLAIMLTAAPASAQQLGIETYPERAVSAWRCAGLANSNGFSTIEEINRLQKVGYAYSKTFMRQFPNGDKKQDILDTASISFSKSLQIISEDYFLGAAAADEMHSAIEEARPDNKASLEISEDKAKDLYKKGSCKTMEIPDL